MSRETSTALDAKDWQILQALQANARLSVVELAEKVSLSASPCWRRVRLLEQRGFIIGYHARLSRQQLGLSVHGFVSVRLENHSPRTAAAFERQVTAIAEVITCHNVSGGYDYQLEVFAADHEAFSKLVRERIGSLTGVKDLYTSICLKEVKPNAGLALPAR
jgi:Lrp/AsnC family leucine-responsive transcriptional regulator